MWQCPMRPFRTVADALVKAMRQLGLGWPGHLQNRDMLGADHYRGSNGSTAEATSARMIAATIEISNTLTLSGGTR